MTIKSFFKRLFIFLILVYPIVELFISIYFRPYILNNTDYSINISNWLIIKDIFVVVNTCILIFYFICKKIGVFTYWISICIVYIFNLFTFIWTSIGLIIYANQFELGDFDTPIIFFGVFSGYISIYVIYRLNIAVSDYIQLNKKKPLLDW